VRTFKRPNLKNKIQPKTKFMNSRRRRISHTAMATASITRQWMEMGWRWYGDGAGVSNGDG